jgi:hypothetical protein
MNSVRRWIAALTAAACGLVLGACASTVSGAPVRATSSSLETDDLTAMLLSVEDVRSIVGTTDLEITETYHDAWAYAEVSPGPCSGVPFNIVVPAYRDSGYEAVSGMNMQSSEALPEYWVDEGVVRLPTEAHAQRFITEAETTWRECAGILLRTVPEEGSDPQFWTIGETADIPESQGLVVSSSLAGVDGYVCSRAMTDKANLVVDVLVCSRVVTDEAVTILHRITSRPPV